VDFPTINVNASRPGADPETMAATVAAPLERRLGEIAGVEAPALLEAGRCDG
jgi:multidrug efflux pump